jgi:hypothetical protein
LETLLRPLCGSIGKGQAFKATSWTEMTGIIFSDVRTLCVAEQPDRSRVVRDVEDEEKDGLADRLVARRCASPAQGLGWQQCSRLE